MSASPLGHAREQATGGSEFGPSPHQKYEDLLSPDGNHRVRIVSDTCRVRWPAFGSLSDITVLDNAENQLHSPQSPFIGHVIADEPMTVPPVSSVNIEVDDLREWQIDSALDHEDMRDDCPGFQYNNRHLPGPCSCECPDEEEYDWRYYAPPPCVVIASDPATGVTIGDYIRAGSLYLRQHESDIRKACKKMFDIEEAGQPEAKCFVIPPFSSNITFIWVPEDGVIGDGHGFQSIERLARRWKSRDVTG